MMRVLFVIDSLAVGGAERSLAALAPHLVVRGLDLHVAYLSEEQGVGPDLEAGGVILHSLSGRGGRLGAVARTTRLVRDVSPDLVHTTLFEADLAGRTAAWISRVPVISSFVTEAYGPEHVHSPEYRAWKVRAAQLADFATARLVDRFHAVSESSASIMSRRLGIPRRKIDVIPRGRDTNTLGKVSDERRRVVRDALGISPDAPLVLAAGRHYTMKGLDLLVRAFPRVVATHPDAQLLVAGRLGPATPELVQLIEAGDIEPNVTLAGYRSDLPDLLSATDVFVLPSRAEGSPGVLLEAMALGAPTVATNIPSVREVAGDSSPTVELTPPESPLAMARAIVLLLDDRDRATQLGAAARKRFEETYTSDAIADQTISLYQRCIGTP